MQIGACRRPERMSVSVACIAPLLASHKLTEVAILADMEARNALLICRRLFVSLPYPDGLAVRAAETGM